MPKPSINLEAAIANAFRAYENEQRITNTRIGSLLVVLLMPAGSMLDYFVYRDSLLAFFYIRLLCAAAAGIILVFLFSQLGRSWSKPLGVVVPLLPAVSIAGMIAMKDGFASPYYAGLNLVLLAVGAVLNWTFLESLFAVRIVLVIYIAAGLLHNLYDRPPSLGVVFNNFYFLILMDIIVVVGTYVQERLRFREFEFRYKLNKSKQDLEDSNRNLEVFNNRLADQNIALNRANREIKEAEAQLVQAEKMASLGRFSAGLMHDVLNPLNYVKTGLFTLQKKSRLLAPDKSAEFTQILADVKDGLDRVQDIVQGLRNFTHPGEQSAELIDLAGILADVRRFVAGGLKDKNISLEINLLPQQMVWIGRNDFSVMLINLLENSIDAFENKTFADGDRPAITVSSRSSGDRTLVAIRDNGSGIDPKIIAKIFDPFFTTKDVGKGTGLGLSICFGMIRGYGGTISVASEQGKFSEFTLDLPANAEAAAQYKIAHAEPIRL